MKVTVQNRSERNRVDRENMIQVCRNPIVEDDFHGFLHRNGEGTEQIPDYNNKYGFIEGGKRDGKEVNS